MNPALVVSASKAFSAAFKACLASNRDLGVRAGMLVDAASKAARAMNADLAMQAFAELELAEPESVPAGSGGDLDPASISWVIFVVVFALLLQLYIAEANRTGEYLLDGHRVRLLLDLSALIGTAYTVKKLTDHAIRRPLD